MNAVHCGLWRLWRGCFACRYPGGVTVRLWRSVVILRWHGYVPPELAGTRLRLGRCELHARRVA